MSIIYLPYLNPSLRAQAANATLTAATSQAFGVKTRNSVNRLEIGGATVSPQMQLKVLLPFITIADKSNVLSIVAETCQGSFGVLPHRPDCATALTAGILSFETEAGGEEFMAIDGGVLVKHGFDVVISTRRAVTGRDLDSLQALVETEFKLADVEPGRHADMSKLEAGSIRRMAQFRPM